MEQGENLPSGNDQNTRLIVFAQRKEEFGARVCHHGTSVFLLFDTDSSS